MAMLLLIAAAAGILVLRLHQPPIIGFIAVGILAGPSCYNLIKSVEQLHMLAEMGIALLLFIVGLKLDLKMMKSMGAVSLAIGLNQVLITTIGGFLLSYLLGMKPIAALYVSVALTFSSTIIIVKLLSDKKETESLHGRIALGLLIVQDIVVILLMVFLSAFTGVNQQQPAYQALMVILKGAGFVGAIWFLSAFMVPRLLASVARSSELLALFGIVWALAMAAVADMLGFSKEIGAFIAGISLASTPYREAIGAKLSNIRDFLLLFFFIELGSLLDIAAVGSQIWESIPLLLYVLIGNPLIMMAITGAMGYRRRTSFLSGIVIGQVSEFSLILMSMGAQFGHIGRDVVGLVILVALVTIGVSTYMILYAQKIYEAMKPVLSVFERKNACREDAFKTSPHGPEPHDTLIFGLGSYGTGIAEQLENRGRIILGIDFDPQAIERWKLRGGVAVFGDAKDSEAARALHFSNIKWIVSSIREVGINQCLLRNLRNAGYAGHIAAAADDLDVRSKLLEAGADLTFSPFEDAAVQASDLIFATEDQIARKAMDKLIESTSGHYVICGYGRMGKQIVKDLTAYNVPCVVVESNPEQLPILRSNAIPHIEGKASEDISLVKAGIQRAKGLIAVAASDEENVFIVLTAKVLNPRLFIVARSILQANEDKLRHAGADRVMSPYVLGGRRMAAAVIKPEVMDFLDLVVHDDSHDTEMATVMAASGAACVGKTLREVNPWVACCVTLLAVQRKGENLIPNPNPDLVLMEGDELLVMGTAAQIEAASKLLGSKSEVPLALGNKGTAHLST